LSKLEVNALRIIATLSAEESWSVEALFGVKYEERVGSGRSSWLWVAFLVCVVALPGVACGYWCNTRKPAEYQPVPMASFYSAHEPQQQELQGDVDEPNTSFKVKDN
jgi:hypothetical protein